MCKHFHIVLLTVILIGVYGDASAQSLPPGCSPGKATDGGSAVCELPPPDVLDPISTFASDFTLTIGSNAVPTTVQTSIADYAVEMNGGGNQTLNLLGGGSVINGVGDSGGVTLQSNSGGNLQLLSEGTIFGGENFGRGLLLITNGGNVDVDIVDLSARGNGITSFAENVSIVSTGHISSDIAGIEATAFGELLDVEVNSISSRTRTLDLMSAADIDLDVTGQLTNEISSQAIRIASGGGVAVDTRDIDAGGTVLDVDSNGGIDAVINGNAMSRIPGSTGGIELRNTTNGNVNITVTGDVSRPIMGEHLDPGVVNIRQLADEGDVNVNLNSVSSSGGNPTDDRDLLFVETSAAQSGAISVQASGPLAYFGEAAVDGIEIVSSSSILDVDISVQDIIVPEIGIDLLAFNGSTGTTNIAARDIVAQSGVMLNRLSDGGAVNMNVENIEFNTFGLTLTFFNTQGDNSVIASTGSIASSDGPSNGTGVDVNAVSNSGGIVIDVNNVSASSCIDAGTSAENLTIITRGHVLSSGTCPFGQAIRAANGGPLTVDVLEGSKVERTTSTGHAVSLETFNTTESAVLNNAGTISAPNVVVIGDDEDTIIVNSGLISGSIDLGAGANSIENQSGGTIHAGAVIDLNDNSALFNEGVFSVGQVGAGVTASTVNVCRS